jgi:hypothetical protein
MSRAPSHRPRTLKEANIEMEAEDQIANYLGTLPQRVAVITSAKTAVLLNILWEIDRQNMLSRGDNRAVYLTTVRERRWMSLAFAKYSLDPLWLCCPDKDVRSLLSHLAPDVAASVAWAVAQWVCRYETFT